MKFNRVIFYLMATITALSLAYLAGCSGSGGTSSGTVSLQFQQPAGVR